VTGQGLPPSRRLRKRPEFEKAYEEGHKVVTPQFALYVRPNGLPHSRLGITTTRRLGKAVVRNRARRLVREAYRKHQDELPSGYDFVFVVRKPLLQLKSTALEPVLTAAAHKGVKRASL
jgi:ribonuclease P protein component